MTQQRQQPQKKLLRTKEEIDAAYPEHKKQEGVEAKIDAIKDFLEYLQRKGVVFCYLNDEITDREIMADYPQAYLPTTELVPYSSSQYQVILASFGIDYHTIMREKEDMLDQFRMRQDEQYAQQQTAKSQGGD